MDESQSQVVASSSSSLLMIKQLASCNKSSRDKALNVLLKKWLPTQTLVSDEDMKKLWKGLFYCVWHADKRPFQTQLIERLSSPLPSLDLGLSIHYFSVFLLTMRREWTGIDALRLDKFYLLIRRFLHYFFQILENNSWDSELSHRLMVVLMERTLLADDKFHGNGVNYHIVSVFLEELRPFLPLRMQVLEQVFGPFVLVMGKVQDKVLLGKIKSSMFDVLVNMGKTLLDAKKSGHEFVSSDDALLLGTIALVTGFSPKFFELGSSVECFQCNRNVLFHLHHNFLTLEKEWGSSGIDIAIPDVDEVPNLVPITSLMELDASADDVVDGSSDKIVRKCRKAKKASSGNDKKENKSKKKKKLAVTDLDTETILIGKKEGNVVSATSTVSVDEWRADTNLISFNKSVMSNLQMQFKKVSAEVGLDNNVKSACDLPQVTPDGVTVAKKRKRAKSMDGQESQNPGLANEGDADSCLTAKSGEESAKKVRFSMKNNLVWKTQTPLPPQSLRLPPSVAPRGSALKKGVLPGPIREMPVGSKKVKQRAKSVKKVRKVIKILNPALNSAKKLKSITTK